MSTLVLMLSKVYPPGSTAPSNRRLPSEVVTKRMGDMVTPVTRRPPNGSVSPPSSVFAAASSGLEGAVDESVPSSAESVRPVSEG